MLTWLMLSLFAVTPPPPPPETPGPSPVPLVVGVTASPEAQRTAQEVARTLGVELAAPALDWTAWLKSRPAGCAREPRCLLTAPGLPGASRLLHLHLRVLAPGRLAVDLRLVDVRGRKVLARRAAVVESAELGAWSEASALRLLSRTGPGAGWRAPSPYAHPARPSAP
ncbi:hypothetical protein [Archangium primigenium]|uniref:hypothetical protein n=1 Tax=[Archangium] primigenium TaxID=2792470 RepID=UPI0019593F87|nr:hypothetical protein [Archangium primigenium]MBM7116616.1 hypothetical protein [Archangium primigenium]